MTLWNFKNWVEHLVLMLYMLRCLTNSTTVYTSAENTMFSRNSTNGIQGKAKVGQKGICFHSVTDQTIVELTL